MKTGNLKEKKNGPNESLRQLKISQNSGNKCFHVGIVLIFREIRMLQETLSNFFKNNLALSQNFRPLEMESIERVWGFSSLQQVEPKQILDQGHIVTNNEESLMKGKGNPNGSKKRSQTVIEDELRTLKKENSNASKNKDQNRDNKKESPLEKHLFQKSQKIQFSFSEVAMELRNKNFQCSDENFMKEVDLLREYPYLVELQQQEEPREQEEEEEVSFQNSKTVKKDNFWRDQLSDWGLLQRMKEYSGGVMDAPKKIKKKKKLHLNQRAMMSQQLSSPNI